MSIREGRLKKSLSKAFQRINSSISFDKKLYREDIKGSKAYARALKKAGVITPKEETSIRRGLGSIEKEIERGEFTFREEDEDIHMNIERALFEKIGPAAHKLHTGRSRNEQVVLDERLYLLDAADTLEKKLKGLLKALVSRAREDLRIIVPSYTHLRQAQPVSLAHLFLAYFHTLRRDQQRLDDCHKRLSVMPLGSGAGVGTLFDLDRDFLRQELGFDEVSRNSVDAVSTRDFIAEFEFICASIFVTLSRISEDMIIYSSDEFGYYTLPDELSTTSSMMPQKKNPDSLELIRGKSARIISNLVSLLVLMKGLPYTYNRDLQEDKEGLFDTVENTLACVEVMKEVFEGLVINEEKIKRVLASSRGFLFATDMADYLVRKGIPFRQAHQIVGQVVAYASDKEVNLQEIPLEQYKKLCSCFEKDVYSIFDYTRSVHARNLRGGTSLEQISEEIRSAEKELSE
ncbi:MAG: argininosuccinate lyase [Spirochaetota bacterium]